MYHPDPTALLDTWPDGPPPLVAFGVGALLSYRNVLSPHSLPHTGRSRVTLDEVTLSQGEGVADATSTPLQAPPTPAPPVSIPTHLVTVGPVPHASASRVSELPTCDHPDCNGAAPVEIANDRPWHPHQDTTDLDGAIPQQRLFWACSPLPPSPSCQQASPEPLACPLVAASELTQVTDLFGYTKDSYYIQIYFLIVILSYSNYIQWGFYWKNLVSTLTLLFLLSRKTLEEFRAQSLQICKEVTKLLLYAARLRLGERRKRREKGWGRETK